MRKFLLAIACAGIAAYGATYNLVTNFNAPNNTGASSVFSYGLGDSPAAFSGFTAAEGGTCLAVSPAYCYQRTEPGYLMTSAVAWNGSGTPYQGGTVLFPTDALRLDPENTAGTMLRFTAPSTAVYSVAGQFQGSDTGQHRTKVEIFRNSEATAFWWELIGSRYDVQEFDFNVALNAGQTIDFVVVSNSDCCYLSTGLKGTITSQTLNAEDDASTPEPATLALVGLALPVLLWRRFAK